MACQKCKAGAPAAGWLWDPLWNNRNCVNNNTQGPCTREDAIAGVCVVQGSCKPGILEGIGAGTQNLAIIAVVIGFIALYIIAKKQGWIK